MFDSLNRRSRYKRLPSGKIPTIKQRDLNVLSLLYRYRCLNSQDLISHIKPKSEKRFIERLGQLYHDAGLIDRPKEQWNFAGAAYNNIVCTLNKKGKNLIEKAQGLPLRAVQYPDQSNGGIRKQFIHSLKLSQAILEAEIETFNNPNQRFVCLDEIREHQLSKGKVFKLEFPVTIPISAKNPHTVFRTIVKPDCLYGIEYTETGKKLYRFFAVEVELSSPKIRTCLKYSSTFKKQLAYDSAIKTGSYKAALGVPNLQYRVFDDF